ncbi:LysM domain-containing protein [Formosa sp. Hel1_31_208]|nr:LysM domain-containing protein [Formosa sp. Hel1_31_208]
MMSPRLSFWHINWYIYNSINTKLKTNIIMVKSKYQSVLDLGQKLNIENGDVKEENGVLKVTGTAKTQYEKNLIWDEIKAVGGDSPSDIMADIKVADESVFHRHTVKSGETLGKIAKQYYGDAMKYKDIFAANTDILKNPDLIHPDQELIIPNL